jgi:hypothetical protein
MHLVKGHPCCPNFLAHPIRREEKLGPTSKLAIYEQKYKLRKQTNRQISLAFSAWHSCLSQVSRILYCGNKIVIDQKFSARGKMYLTRAHFDLSVLLIKWGYPLII